MELSKGVYLAKNQDNSTYYRASITYKNKHISLGSFSSESSAHNAYLLASQILFEKLTSYDQEFDHNILSFEKWIILHNYRDNGYYVKTPIYMHKNYFSYFLNPGLELEFDVDDLFYFSTHKIFHRNGYFFVNHYGSQVNIYSRYGIKNFAVLGKDYLFKDNNPNNFRYENIEVINKYIGVEKSTTNGIPVYIAKIHLHGNFLIGRYANEIKAAIAYNKAADYVNQMNFCNKEFERNYIENLNKTSYQEIYQQIKLPPKILLYFSQKNKLFK